MRHRHAGVVLGAFWGLLASLVVLRPAAALQGTPNAPLTATYRAVADSLIHAATRDSAAYRRLGDLVDGFGHRLSGSKSLEAAIDWILAQMKKDGLANVHGEPAMVSHWVRGQESAELIRPRRMRLSMLGLGMSVGTPKAGIQAPVLVVSSFDELERRASEARGKIVLFDAPFTTYGQTVQYRQHGPDRAAKVGAVAVLIRSVASYSIDSPHTGNIRYDSNATARRIPAAALSVEDAMMLHRMQDRGDSVVVRLKMEAHQLPDAPSRNVVAEVVGRERPDEVVVVSGHIDSWDVGQGAMDDGGGAVAAWEAVRLMHALSLRPRRTVRVVLWTNEENRSSGARAYREAHAAELAKHVFALESDEGVFQPKGFQFKGNDRMLALVRQAVALLDPVGADSVHPDTDAPADVDKLAERGVPAAGLEVDGSRYFWYHHSNGDTLDKLDPAEMGRCVAAMAVLAYVMADLPEATLTGAGR